MIEKLVTVPADLSSGSVYELLGRSAILTGKSNLARIILRDRQKLTTPFDLRLIFHPNGIYYATFYPAQEEPPLTYMAMLELLGKSGLKPPSSFATVDLQVYVKYLVVRYMGSEEIKGLRAATIDSPDLRDFMAENRFSPNKPANPDNPKQWTFT